MELHQSKTQIIRRLMIRAAKMPIVYIIIGTLLIALAYIDDIFPLTEFKQLFDLTDSVGNIFLALALLSFIYKFSVLLLRRTEKRLYPNHRVASVIITSFRKGLRVIYFLAFVNIVITIVGPTKYYLVLANTIINTTIIASIGWIAIQALYTFETVVYQQMFVVASKENKRAKALYTKTHVIRNVATVVIIVITIAAILMSFSSVRNIGISLLASAGFLTAIIGLAAQRTLFSVFSGLQIALSQQIKIGDVVVVDKDSGIIEEITFTYVTLKLGDRRRLIVPISYFIERPFENWSHDHDSLRSSILLHVDHLMPIPPLREKLTSILSESNHWDGIASKLQVANLGSQSVEVRIQVSAANADRLSDLRAEVREKMLVFIQQHYPQFFPKVTI